MLIIIKILFKEEVDLFFEYWVIGFVTCLLMGKSPPKTISITLYIYYIKIRFLLLFSNQFIQILLVLVFQLFYFNLFQEFRQV